MRIVILNFLEVNQVGEISFRYISDHHTLAQNTHCALKRGIEVEHIKTNLDSEMPFDFAQGSSESKLVKYVERVMNNVATFIVILVIILALGSGGMITQSNAQDISKACAENSPRVDPSYCK